MRAMQLGLSQLTINRKKITIIHAISSNYSFPMWFESNNNNKIMIHKE